MVLMRLSLMIGLVAINLLAHASDQVTTLPTIRIMAESELREEVGFVPFQQQAAVQQALQHHIEKIEKNVYITQVYEPLLQIQDPVIGTAPDLSQFSPALQQYILAVAAGFQSNDPTQGVLNMLKPLNMDQHHLEQLQNGTIQIKLDDLLQLQQKIQDGLNRH